MVAQRADLDALGGQAYERHARAVGTAGQDQQGARADAGGEGATGSGEDDGAGVRVRLPGDARRYRAARIGQPARHGEFEFPGAYLVQEALGGLGGQRAEAGDQVQGEEGVGQREGLHGVARFLAHHGDDRLAEVEAVVADGQGELPRADLGQRLPGTGGGVPVDLQALAHGEPELPEERVLVLPLPPALGRRRRRLAARTVPVDRL